MSNSLMNILMVSGGGAIGAALRYLMTLFAASLSLTSLPLGTFAVNIIGSFLIGLFFPLVKSNQSLQLFLITGLLGGFTTFSAFSLENLMLLEAGKYWSFLCYALASVLLGLVFAYLGYKLSISA